MRLLIIILSMLFILNAEDLKVDNKLKKPPNPDNDMILNSKAKFPQSIILIVDSSDDGGHGNAARSLDVVGNLFAQGD